jgi:hypothetical protein
MAPHSRHTTVRREDIESVPELQILASSEEAGVYVVRQSRGNRYLSRVIPIDADTLEKEYLRDKNAGLPIDMPKNYYPSDDDTRRPIVSWRSSANLLFMNWLNYFVYQATPYELDAIGTERKTTGSDNSPDHTNGRPPMVRAIGIGAAAVAISCSVWLIFRSQLSGQLPSLNFSSMWAPSQKGLSFDLPQRQST